jgi:hypothetical protein
MRTWAQRFFTTAAIAVAALFFLGGATPSRAGVIYSDLGGTYTEGYGIGTFGTTDLAYAAEFTPSESVTLSEIQVVISAADGGSLNAAVETDAGGQPGSALETFSFTDLPDSFTLETADSVLDPTLDAGTPYWLVLSAEGSDEGGWADNTVSASGNLDACTSYPSCSSWSEYTTPADGALPAFEIDGTLTATPEPSTAILWGFGAAALLGWRRRRTA